MNPKSDAIEPLDLAHWRLALETKRRTAAEYETASALAQNFVEGLARKYGLANGDSIQPDGTIKRPGRDCSSPSVAPVVDLRGVAEVSDVEVAEKYVESLGSAERPG